MPPRATKSKAVMQAAVEANLTSKLINHSRLPATAPLKRRRKLIDDQAECKDDSESSTSEEVEDSESEEIKGRITLTPDKLMFRVKLFKDHCCKPFADDPPLEQVLLAMMRGGHFTVSTSFIEAPGGGMEYHRSEALWRLTDHPTDASMEDIFAVFFAPTPASSAVAVPEPDLKLPARKRDEAGLQPTPLAKPFLHTAVADNTALAANAVARKQQNLANLQQQQLQVFEDKDRGPSRPFTEATEKLWDDANLAARAQYAFPTKQGTGGATYHALQATLKEIRPSVQHTSSRLEDPTLNFMPFLND